MDIAAELLKDQKKAAVTLGYQWEGKRGSKFNKNFIYTQWNGTQMDLGSPYLFLLLQK